MINDLRTKIKILSESSTSENSIERIQDIFDKLSTVISLFGTKQIDDIIYVLFGTSFNLFYPSESISDELHELYEAKFDLIKKYASFTDCKNISSKNKKILKLDIRCVDKKENVIDIESSSQLECYEPTSRAFSFHYSIYGIRIIIQNKRNETSIILNGTIEDIPVEWVYQNAYLTHRKKNIIQHLKSKPNINESLLDRLIQSLSIRDYLIFSEDDIFQKYTSILNDVDYVKKTTVDLIVKKFKSMDTVNKRRLLINLVLYNDENEIQYIAYMLYDLMSETHFVNDSTDSPEQKIIFNSFSCKIRTYFKEVMKNTIQYSNFVSTKYDSSKITLEQQVFFMKATDAIKERAVTKLKELKNKTEEQGGKIKQYLEGLLKIPFGVFKEEIILTIVKDINQQFVRLIAQPAISRHFQDLTKTKYTLFEINYYIKKMKPIIECEIKTILLGEIPKLNKLKLIDAIQQIKNIESIVTKNTATKASMISFLTDYIENIDSNYTCDSLFETRYKIYKLLFQTVDANFLHKYNNIITIPNDIKTVKNKTKDISLALDKSIYGHKNAKTQILKIISQWINGENSGYCFGFEGSPGIGKTSLAKRGLAKCLVDENGTSRPFSFIAMGGSCNGSVLEGHNYTYVNSSWGRIVDILMESKCLNPIIYIDELDKISKTEQGREIVGILTHLIDSTQNDEFQDKYFSGIPIDLSKEFIILR